MSYGYGYGYGSFTRLSMDELRSKAHRTIAELSKKGDELEPVVITGRKITATWWGDAWCNNLERYADYANRIDRGKRYVCAECVIDLKIAPGQITALVIGTRKTPYRIDVSVKPMSKELYQDIINRCSARAASLEALAAGDFPEELKEQLFAKNNGIFPSPKEISLKCSCPDGAYLCKHIAAALYAVGSKLDTEPLLLFTLRGIDTGALIKRTVEEKLSAMLANANKPSPRILDANQEQLTTLFGVL